MTESELYNGTVVSGTTDFVFVNEMLGYLGVRWCVVGGFAINAFAEPIYTADLELVVEADALQTVLEDMHAAGFHSKESASLVNVQRRATPGARFEKRLSIQFVRSDRFQSFLDRARLKILFGMDVPVAAMEDLVRSKLWAWVDPGRRTTKKLRDKLDLLRLAEAHPSRVEPLLPEELRVESVVNREQKADDSSDGWDDEQDVSAQSQVEHSPIPETNIIPMPVPRQTSFPARKWWG